MSWYLKVLRNYAGFGGRARRQEYWMFVLVSCCISLGLTGIDFVINLITDSSISIFQGIYGLAVFIPSLAVTIRRLHDIGKSGWFYLVILIPIAGPIWLLVLLCTEGNNYQNEYGFDPKQIAYEI